MTKLADLHIHTFYSDSTSSPEEVVDQAHQKGLGGIAITDHDTIDAIAITSEAAGRFGIEVIPGIELSTETNKKDIHMLAYFFDYQKSPLVEKISEFQEARLKRIEEMIRQLAKLGIDNITAEEVCAQTRSKSVGRPHLAAILKQKGWVKDIREAFNKYLAEGAPAYVPKFKQSPYEAIELIRSSGGVAVMAHPMVTNRDQLIPSFVEAGMGGLEVYYPNCPENIIHYYEGIAKKHNLVTTGGSDAHGDAKPNTHVGKASVDYDLVEKLRERSKSA